MTDERLKGMTDEQLMAQLQPKILFSTDPEISDPLDKKIVSKGLRLAFKKKGISLSDNVTVWVEAKSGKWLVTDEVNEQTYIIRREINIYQQGEGQALAKLMQKYQVPIFSYCYRLLGNPEKAEDATQDTFERVWREAGSFDTNRKFRPWLYRIARNVCLDKMKENGKQPEISAGDILQTASETQETEEYDEADESDEEDYPASFSLPVADDETIDANQEIIVAVRECVEQLKNPEDQEMIWLRHGLGLSIREIAKVMGLKKGKVEYQLKEGEKKIKACLKAKGISNISDRFRIIL